ACVAATLAGWPDATSGPDAPRRVTAEPAARRDALHAKAGHAFFASFLGWTLDAFDFFVLVFVLPAVAEEFHRSVADVAYSITLTLAMRPVGALLFGWLADRYGR